MYKLSDITDTLPVGILSDSEFTPDCAGLAVRLTGYFTIGELKAIVEDLIHVDAVYQSKKINRSMTNVLMTFD